MYDNNNNKNGKFCCFIWLTKTVLYILRFYLFIKTYSLFCLVWSMPKNKTFYSLSPLICSLFLSEPNWTGWQIGPTASCMWPQARACQLPLLSSIDDRYIRSGFSCRAPGEWEEAALILAQRWEVYCVESLQLHWEPAGGSALCSGHVRSCCLRPLWISQTEAHYKTETFSIVQ